MSRLTPRKMKALQTKQRILETALELFSEKGFDRVTVDEIVSKSETSKGAFYVHFNSKYEIFLEKFKEIDDFYASFIQSLPSGISSHEKLLLFTQSQMIYLRDSLGRDIMRTVYMSGLLPAQINYFSNTDRNLYKIVYSIIKEGQESGEIKKDLSPNEVTMLVTRCMRGTLYDWLLFEKDYDLIEESQKFIRAILGGIEE